MHKFNKIGRLKMNKKGDAGNIMEDSVSLFIIILLVVSFFVFAKLYFVFTEKQIDLKIEENSKFSEIEFATREIKNLSFNINNELMSFSKLARLSKIDSKYGEIFDSKLKELNNGGFGIEIKEVPLSQAYGDYGDAAYIIVTSSKPIIFEITKS